MWGRASIAAIITYTIVCGARIVKVVGVPLAVPASHPLTRRISHLIAVV